MALRGIGRARLRKLVGEVQRGQHGHAQRVRGTPLRCHCAHLCIHLARQLLNVRRIVAGQVIELIVDLNRYKFRCLLVGSAAIGASYLQRVKLRKQPLHPVPHRVPLGAQAEYLVLQLLNERRLLVRVVSGSGQAVLQPSLSASSASAMRTSAAARACRSCLSISTARNTRSSSAEKSSTLTASATGGATSSVSSCSDLVLNLGFECLGRFYLIGRLVFHGRLELRLLFHLCFCFSPPQGFRYHLNPPRIFKTPLPVRV